MNKKIIACLRYGKLLQNGIMKFCFIVMIVCYVVWLPMGIVLTITEKDPTFLLGLMFPILMTLLCLVLRPFFRKTWKWVEVCLQDAVVVKAKCTKFWVDEFNFQMTNYTYHHSIRISFEYNGEERVCESSDGKREPMLPDLDIEKYVRLFSPYINKELEVLYSPSHNEVLFFDKCQVFGNVNGDEIS